eukprot:gnl/TRDRNA2_/TRDRNA2_150164_c1_seq1.p1 gnl/TRDRNA2_/TRDRNA2_150164_c1~~gnl/TRDRNA2_/TRDRNA2_150164_c1_seq1.p1  ORF type:complete len:580 (+),score=45.81 gnl/TRDRNA2_/TRDRNA2_150164_c1_seq1:236-1741(+)
MAHTTGPGGASTQQVPKIDLGKILMASDGIRSEQFAQGVREQHEAHDRSIAEMNSGLGGQEGYERKQSQTSFYSSASDMPHPGAGRSRDRHSGRDAALSAPKAGWSQPSSSSEVGASAVGRTAATDTSAMPIDRSQIHPMSARVEESVVLVTPQMTSKVVEEPYNSRRSMRHSQSHMSTAASNPSFEVTPRTHMNELSPLPLHSTIRVGQSLPTATSHFAPVCVASSPPPPPMLSWTATPAVGPTLVASRMAQRMEGIPRTASPLSRGLIRQSSAASTIRTVSPPRVEMVRASSPPVRPLSPQPSPLGVRPISPMRLDSARGTSPTTVAAQGRAPSPPNVQGLPPQACAHLPGSASLGALLAKLERRTTRQTLRERRPKSQQDDVLLAVRSPNFLLPNSHSHALHQPTAPMQSQPTPAPSPQNFEPISMQPMSAPSANPQQLLTYQQPPPMPMGRSQVAVPIEPQEPATGPAPEQHQATSSPPTQTPPPSQSTFYEGVASL